GTIPNLRKLLHFRNRKGSVAKRFVNILGFYGFFGSSVKWLIKRNIYMHRAFFGGQQSFVYTALVEVFGQLISRFADKIKLLYNMIGKHIGLANGLTYALVYQLNRAVGRDYHQR